MHLAVNHNPPLLCKCQHDNASCRCTWLLRSQVVTLCYSKCHLHQLHDNAMLHDAPQLAVRLQLSSVWR